MQESRRIVASLKGRANARILPMSDFHTHWDNAYEGGEDSSSWFQESGGQSAAMITMHASPSDSVIDVGGGASRLVDDLVRSGFTNISVIDLSDAGMALARDRLGSVATRISWTVADVLTWEPTQQFEVWHDRAVLHFLTEPDQQSAYMKTLRKGVGPGALVVIGVFAEDGPDRCSGLPVRRFSQAELSNLLGPDFKVVLQERVEHTTPGGKSQPFNWIAARLETA